MADSGCFPPAAGKGVESRAARSSVCCLRSVTSKHLFRRLESVHGLYHYTALLRRACQPGARSCKPPRPRCWLEGAPAYQVIVSGTSKDLAISLSVCLSFGLAVCAKGQGGGSPIGWSWLTACPPCHRGLEKGFLWDSGSQHSSWELPWSSPALPVNMVTPEWGSLELRQDLSLLAHSAPVTNTRLVFAVGPFSRVHLFVACQETGLHWSKGPTHTSNRDSKVGSSEESLGKQRS